MGEHHLAVVRFSKATAAKLDAYAKKRDMNRTEAAEALIATALGRLAALEKYSKKQSRKARK